MGTLLLRLRCAAFGFFSLGLTGCTFQTSPPLITLRLTPPPPEARGVSAAGPSRGRVGGPPLADISCFAVFATGTSQSVTESQVAGRSPSCLGMAGEFLGYFSYSQLTGLPNQSGVTEPPAQIALPPGVYGFSVVALHNAAQCSGALDSLYVTSTPTETYPITSTTSIDTRTISTGSLAVTYAQGVTTNRTPNCLPTTFSCEGAIVCDSFTGSDGTSIADHTADSGHLWTYYPGPGGNMQLFSGTLRLFEIGGKVGHAISSIALNGNKHLQGSLQVGGDDGGEAGLILRYVDPANFVFGSISRNDNSHYCAMNLVDHVAGSPTIIASRQLSYPEECPRLGYSVISFQEVAGNLTLRYRGFELSLGYVGTNNGGGAGVGASMGALTSDVPQFDWFKIL